MKMLHLHNSISIKQILFLWLALCLLPGMAHATGKHFGSYYSKYESKRISDRHHKNGHRTKQCKKHCDNALTIPLLVDQKIQVGVVKVTYDEHRLNIKYVANKGWLIENTHLAVANSFEELPQDAYGNPKLHRFPYKTSHKRPVQTVNQMLSAKRWPIGTELYITAQASVIVSKSLHHGKVRFKAKSWSGKWDKSMKSSGGDKNYHYRDDYSDNKDDQSEKADSSLAKYDSSNFFFQRLFYGKQKQQKYRENNTCAKGSKKHKRKKCSVKVKSAWAKGYDFPGPKQGFYFTYLLKPCEPPVVDSTIQFSNPVYNATEDDASAIVSVTREGDLSTTATVLFVTSDGTAIAGVDYGMVEQQIVFNPGDSEIDVLIPIIDDSEAEETETVNLQLLDVQGATLGEQDTAVLEIADNEPVVFIFDPAVYSVVEPDRDDPPAEVTVTITVKRLGSLNEYSSVDIAVVGGTARMPRDYFFMPTTLEFFPGDATPSEPAVIEIVGDNIGEDNETVLFGFGGPVNGDIGEPSQAELTIIDNDGN